MSEIENLEEIAAQTSIRVNKRTNRGKIGWDISPNIEHTHLPHEPKPAKTPPASRDEPASQPLEFSGAQITSYTELITAIKEQVGAMGVRYEDFDELCDFAPGMTGKAFGPAQVKRLGPEKLFDALRAAGLRLKVEIDPEQQTKMKARCEAKFNPRQANQARPNNHASTISSHVLSRAFGHVLRKARKQRWAGKTAEERSKHASMIANVRWKAERKRRNAAHRQRQKKKERASDTMCAG